MEFYQINDLERLSGIKAHTIRIWEKRYNLVEPHRTSTNIRYYDDAQVKKLLNVATLLDNGYKISKVANLPESEFKDIIKQIQETSPSNTVNTAFINDLIKAMLAFDEVAFEKIFSAAATRLGMYKAMIEVFYPFLHKTGILWTADESSPAQEHFATGIIKRKLLAATDGLPPATKNNKKFLLFLPTEEWHDVGLLFSDYIIRSHGYPTVYLGQNMPSQNIDFVAKKIKPTHMLTFFISGNDQKEAQLAIVKTLKTHKSITCLVSGYIQPHKIFDKEKSLIILKSPDELLKIL